MSDSDFVFFFGPGDPNEYLSNWSEISITENGLTFPTTEHYFMYHKAIYFKDRATAEKIYNAKEPTLARKLGRQVKNFDEDLWEISSIGIMKRALQLKVEQYPDLLEKLLKTKNKIIAEATPFDKKWGIGLRMTDPKALDQKNWTGKNLLGKLWSLVRDEYLE
jgi:ribA/ribD-fused uncharacterized protein